MILDYIFGIDNFWIKREKIVSKGIKQDKSLVANPAGLLSYPAWPGSGAAI